MKPNPVVLIVSAGFGDGHAKVAEAIEQSFIAKGIDQVFIVDLFAEVHPYLNEISRRFYMRAAVYVPKLYGILYRITSRMKPQQPLSQFLHSIGQKKAKALLDELQPDIIIHTFPYLVASRLSEEAGNEVSIFTVLTDYVLHGRWLHPYTMKYFTATESMKQELLAAGVPEERITISGIPIRAAFRKPMDRGKLLIKHGFSESRRYILLAAGAYGVMSNISMLINTVHEYSDFDLIVLCGNNDGLRVSLVNLYLHNPRIHILGYTEEMHELMAVSSGLLTKAGGITLTEAMAMSLPVIVYRPLPGQEEGNAHLLTGLRVIYTAYNKHELIHRLRQLEIQPCREEMQRFMHTLTREESSQTIVSEVLTLHSNR
ncbi:MGDG synthase family glycosyltransferase [Paenibacillus monticola]|uniref:Glycosyltransferase n=1 Tax=Paenibacillus monticola TaxID=2666075 RepID=A0A7X2H6M1_9BACL|nr:UDP-N-acetylglucosamine 2-epimerase [Paenibacillus monticola]MRN54403.1 glycosyltransferase [Paenibacillus monticola]